MRWGAPRGAEPARRIFFCLSNKPKPIRPGGCLATPSPFIPNIPFQSGVATTTYIRSTHSIPNRASPVSSTLAVSPHSARRLSRSSGVSAFTTGQFWKNSE